MKRKACLLGDVCKFIDYRGKTPPKTNAGIPLITAKIIKHGAIQKPQEFIQESFYDEWMRRGIPKRGDVIFTTEAPLGEVAQIKTDEKLAFAQRVIILEADEIVLHSDYLFYALQDTVLKNRIEARSSGTTVFGIKASELKKVEIDLPAMETQKKIGEVLSKIDDTIALNQQINKNLEEQAQAIFKAWFEDYEPFGGEAPNEFISMTLGRVAEIKTDSISPSKNPNVKVEHYSIPAYDEKHFPVFETTDDIKSNKYIITDKSVIISKLNPDTKRIWRPMCLSEHPICSTEFIVYEARNPAHKDFLYSLIDSVRFYNYLCSHTTGSTNSRQRATPSATLDFEFLLPSDEWIKKFCLIVTPIYDMISANLMENQALANLRDALLPRLMSGEIDVSGIEILPNDLAKAVADSRERHNLHGPFDSAEEAVASMLKEG